LKVESFYNLSVHQIFDVAESLGFQPTGQYFQLNSYENRVFDLFLEKEQNNLDDHVICKVYRPKRWSEKAILEEHQFIEELKSQDIPAISALKINGKTIHLHNEMFFSFFPKAKGRMPQELLPSELSQLGSQLAKLHNVGAQKKALHRPSLDIEAMGWQALDFIEPIVAPEVWPRYERAACDILNYLEDQLENANLIRIHGDCHKGNILQFDPKEGEKKLFFVDFDDFINGLPIQDFWMLFSKDETDNSDELESFLLGYERLRHFDRSHLKLMPAFRGLRIINYAYWIAKRWSDPSFPQLFPNFKNYIYWAEEVEALEKISWQLE
jgi:Ser/Thr protein kinase RdoA (MazF antagonist)